MAPIPAEQSPAPLFTLADHNGNPVSLKSFQGRKVALYFYPKDLTPGCTTQACNLRDNFDVLEKHTITVIGVSPDSSASHANFRTKKALPFILLANPDHSVLEQYDVWGEKSMYGRTFMGVKRTTFLIDEHGIIVAIIAKPKVSDHAREILEGFGLTV